MSDNLRGALYMVIAMAAFTLNDAGMKLVTETVPLFEAIALRGAISLAFLLGLAYQQGALGRGAVPRGEGRVLALRTVAEMGATMLFLAALMQMPLANLAAVMQVLPLAVTLGAALYFHEPIGWRRLTAIGIGFCGVLLIIQPGSEGFDVWSLLGLASVACVVVRDLATRRFSRGVPSVLIAVWASAAVTAMGLAGSVAGGWHVPDAGEAVLIGASALALIVGYMLSVMVMRVGDIGFVAPFRYTALIWAIALGWFVFGTLPDGLTLAGAGLVIATGLFTLWRERKLAQAPRRAG
jgi:drug/metabolite transporter (DMT)-like permease